MSWIQMLFEMSCVLVSWDTLVLLDCDFLCLRLWLVLCEPLGVILHISLTLLILTLILTELILRLSLTILNVLLSLAILVLIVLILTLNFIAQLLFLRVLICKLTIHVKVLLLHEHFQLFWCHQLTISLKFLLDLRMEFTLYIWCTLFTLNKSGIVACVINHVPFVLKLLPFLLLLLNLTLAGFINFIDVFLRGPNNFHEVFPFQFILLPFLQLFPPFRNLILFFLNFFLLLFQFFLGESLLAFESGNFNFSLSFLS